jgi:adenylate kinase
MNKKGLEEKKKNRLFIIGSARGVNRFYITNKFIERISTKTINTGAFIFDLTKKLNLKEFDDLSIKEYFQVIEPLLVQSVRDHLEHQDVILDTHFHYMMPALSLNSLLELKDCVSEIILVLVDEKSQIIFERNIDSPDWWFKNIQNIDKDVKLNNYFFDFYKNVFSIYIKTRAIRVDITEEEHKKQIEEFINNLI